MHLLLAATALLGAASVGLHLLLAIHRFPPCPPSNSFLQAMPYTYVPAQYIPADEVLVRVPRQLVGVLNRPVRQDQGYAPDQETAADTAYGAAPVSHLVTDQPSILSFVLSPPILLPWQLWPLQVTVDMVSPLTWPTPGPSDPATLLYSGRVNKARAAGIQRKVSPTHFIAPREVHWPTLDPRV